MEIIELILIICTTIIGGMVTGILLIVCAATHSFIPCWIYSHFVNRSIGKEYNYIMRSSNVVETNWDDYYDMAMRKKPGYDPHAIYCFNGAFHKEGYGDNLYLGKGLMGVDYVLITSGDPTKPLFDHLCEKKFGHKI